MEEGFFVGDDTRIIFAEGSIFKDSGTEVGWFRRKRRLVREMGRDPTTVLDRLEYDFANYVSRAMHTTDKDRVTVSASRPVLQKLIASRRWLINIARK